MVALPAGYGVGVKTKNGIDVLGKVVRNSNPQPKERSMPDRPRHIESLHF
jgi:hypothetical protein